MNERDRQLIDALQDSLERIEAGLSPAEALARHEGLREDLAPRLEAAMTVRALRSAPAPAFDAAFRARLEAVDAEADRGILIAFERWQAPLMRAAAVILAVGLALGTASYAAAARLPEEHWLRPLALRIDRVRAVVWEAAESVLPEALRPAHRDGGEDSLVDLDHASSGVQDSNAVDAGRSADAADSDASIGRDASGEDRVSPILRQAEASAPERGLPATAAALRSAPISVPPVLSSTATAIAIAPISRPTLVASLPGPAQPTAEPPTAAPAAPTDAPKEDPPKEQPKPTDVPTATAAPPREPGPPGGGDPGDPGEPGDPDPPVATGVIEGLARWNDDGRPLWRNFRVVLIAADACPRGPGGIQALGVTKTDDEGRFRFEGLAAGSYKVGVKIGQGERGQEFFVWAPNERDCDRAEAQTLEAGQTIEVEIRVKDPRGGPGGPGQSPPGRDPGHEPPRDPGRELPGATAVPPAEPTAEPTAEAERPAEG